MVSVLSASRQRLQDLSAFSGLGEVAREFGVTLHLFGGTATRAAMYAVHRPDADPDLFDLSPFASDIDLAHSGAPELTSRIHAAIQDRVPFASWCRWSILDAGKWREVQGNMGQGVRIPLRHLRFSTDGPADWPVDATADLEAARVTVRRNPDFASSSFAEAGRTVEVFGLFLALNTLAEMKDIVGDGALDIERPIADWLFGTGGRDDGTAIAASARLSARAWHLAATRQARSLGEAAGTIAEWHATHDTLAPFGMSAWEVYGSEAFSVSRLAGDGRFLLPELLPSVLAGRAAERRLARRLEILRSTLDLREAPRIDPAFRAVALIDDLSLLVGSSMRDEEGDEGAFMSGSMGEFVHVSWPYGSGGQDEGLTALALPSTDDAASAGRMALLPGGAAVGGVFPGGSAWLRIDVEAITRGLPPGVEPVGLSIAVLAPRTEASSRPGVEEWTGAAGDSAVMQGDVMA